MVTKGEAAVRKTGKKKTSAVSERHSRNFQGALQLSRPIIVHSEQYHNIISKPPTVLKHTHTVLKRSPGFRILLYKYCIIFAAWLCSCFI